MTATIAEFERRLGLLAGKTSQQPFRINHAGGIWILATPSVFGHSQWHLDGI